MTARSDPVRPKLERLTERLLWGLASLGLTPSSWPGSACGTAILEVRCRRSGRLQSILVTWAEHEGVRYLVSMTGEAPQWVQNMRAAGGNVTLRHGSRRNEVHLEELPASERAAVIKTWYGLTGLSPVPRRYFKLDREAAVEEFDRIAARHPVFRIASRG